MLSARRAYQDILHRLSELSHKLGKVDALPYHYPLMLPGFQVLFLANGSTNRTL